MDEAKAAFLTYKANGGEMDALEWTYYNAPALFNEWQDGVCCGCYIYYQ